MLLATAILTTLASPAFQAPPEDPSAPLRRFPVSIMVHRPGVPVQEVSLLRLSALKPKDEVEVKVGDKLTSDWTFAAAYLEAGHKPRVRSWNLWDRKWRSESIKVGTVPDGDVVPLFFLVLNRRRDGRVGNALQKVLETSSEQVVTTTASFETTYRQQNRLYNFMIAYSSLGARAEYDPCLYKTSIDRLGADLGVPPSSYTNGTSPTELRRNLDIGVGVLSELRKSPEDPTTVARITQTQLPGIVSDWLGLASDLVSIFIRPRKDLKVMVVPASASETTSYANGPDEWMDLVTERVLETKEDAVPAMVYRPIFSKTASSSPFPLSFDRTSVVTPANEVAIPLAGSSRDLFTKPWAWDWQVSYDGKTYSNLSGARLVAGRGLVFPVTEGWWGGANEKQIWVRANVGFQAQTSAPVRVTRAFTQQWKPEGTDFAVGDGYAQITLQRTGGTNQPFYSYSAASLTDSSGNVIPATGVRFADKLTVTFNLGQAAAGTATLRVQQEGSPAPDAPMSIFIAPKRPTVSFTIAKGDNVLSANGPDLSMVKSVVIPSASVVRMDPGQGERNYVLGAPLPTTVNAIEVTYFDPARPYLQWQRSEPVSFGSPRPRFGASLIGTLPDQIDIGSNGVSAIATMPAGWFRTRQPIRLKLSAVAPFAWTHDLNLNVGFGSANDVQSVIPYGEGPSFTIDTTIQAAGLTLTIDDSLPKNAMRYSGLVWVRINRGDLGSQWTLATVSDSPQAMPLRAVRLPNVLSVASDANGVKITLGAADDVVGVRWTADGNPVVPTLVESTQNGLTAYVIAPAGTTEFDLQMRDAPEGVVHVKLAAK